MVVATAVLIARFMTAAAAQGQTAASAGVPIRLDDEVVLHVKAGLGGFSAEDRARTAEARIQRIAGDPFYSADFFALREQGDSVAVLYRSEVVGMVTANDAADTPGGAGALASKMLEILKGAIERHHQRLLPAARLQATVIVAFATLVLIAVLLGIRRLFRKTTTRLAANPQHHISRLQLQAIHGTKIALAAAAAAIYLETAFTVIPLTRAYGLSLLDYVVAPLQVLWQGFRLHLGDLVFIAVVVLLTRYGLRLLRWFLSAAADGAVSLPFASPEWAMLLYNIMRLIVLAIAAVTIYPYIPGSSTEAFKGIGLVGGALLTLGASGTAGNFIGGLVLVFSGSFRIGDVLKIGDVFGRVVETNLLLTRVRTIKNEVVTIPNSSLVGGQLTNYSTKAREEGLILHTMVTIGYDAPWRTVHQLLIDAALKTPDILAEPAPFVLQRSLDDFFVSYEINAYTRHAERMVRTYSALHANIQDSFNAGGVEIMSPHYGALRDGNAATIPGQPTPPGEAPRRFAVSVDRPRTDL